MNRANPLQARLELAAGERADVRHGEALDARDRVRPLWWRGVMATVAQLRLAH